MGTNNLSLTKVKKKQTYGQPPWHFYFRLVWMDLKCILMRTFQMNFFSLLIFYLVLLIWPLYFRCIIRNCSLASTIPEGKLIKYRILSPEIGSNLQCRQKVNILFTGYGFGSPYHMSLCDTYGRTSWFPEYEVDIWRRGFNCHDCQVPVPLTSERLFVVNGCVLYQCSLPPATIACR